MFFIGKGYECKKQLGERIKRIGKQRGFTKEKLSEMIDISPKNLSNIEQEIYFVKADTLEKILTALDVTAEDLFATDSLKPNEELLKDINKIVESFRDDKEKLEIVYKIVKALKF